MLRSFLTKLGIEPVIDVKTQRCEDAPHSCHPEFISGSSKMEVQRMFRGKIIAKDNNCKIPDKFIFRSRSFPKITPSGMTFDFLTKIQKQKQYGACKVAFTLAEVLITLGIIGVVAALTLPTLINSTQKKELETGFKKQYSVLNQALLRMSLDLGEPIIPANYPGRTFAPEFIKYLNKLKYCGNTSCVPYVNETGVGFVVNNYKTYNKSKTVVASVFDDGQLVMTDGSLIMIENPATSIDNQRIFITIDINGYKKLPNAWGHDLFTFQITNDGKLLPMGAEGTTYMTDSYCSITSTNSVNGIACAYKALTEKDYFKNLK